MRSRHALKTTTVLIALSLQIAPLQAHANFISDLVNAFFASKAPVNQQGTNTSIVDSTKPLVSDTHANSTSTPGVTLDNHVNAGEQVFGKIEKDFSLNLRDILKVEVIQVNEVNNAQHSELKFIMNENGLILQLRYDSVALAKPYLSIANLILFEDITKNNSIKGISLEGLSYREKTSHYLRYAELFRNAEAGSLSASAQLKAVQLKALNSAVIGSDFPDSKLAVEQSQEIKAKLSEEIKQLNEAAIAQQKLQQKKLDRWKTETQTLDKYEAMDEKLEALILKNDRKGVAELLRAYLPWALMEPVEAQTWKTWLSSIESPDLSKTTVAFRGLDYNTDKIQRQKTPNGEIYGFMSTVLTKNQGNYNRRLRSLSTNRVKNGDVLANGVGKLFEKKTDVLSVRILDQMYIHSLDPKASSFLSFTYDPAIAKKFLGKNQQKMVDGKIVELAHGGFLAVRMDSRRLVPNLASRYAGEIELLAPLIVFPDEVIKYHEGNFESFEAYKNFVKEISEKTSIDFTKGVLASTGENPSLKKAYEADGLKFLEDVFNRTSNAGAANYCGKVLL